MVGTRVRMRRPAPVSELLEGLGGRMRKARLEAGLSQAQVGVPHFTRAYVSAIELGKVRPSMKSLEFFATRLGKPTSFFIEDEADEQRRKEREARIARVAQLVAEGRSGEAIDDLEALRSDCRSPLERAFVLRNLGRAYWEVGEYPKSASVLNDALVLYRAADDLEGTVRTKVQLGTTVFALLSVSEAEVLWTEGLTALSRGDIKDPVLKVHVLHNLGLVHFHRGNFAVALTHFERAELEGSDIGDPKWLATLYAAIGMSHHQVADFEAAAAYLRRSEVLFESINNRARVAETRMQRGRALRKLGNRAKGRAVLDEAEELARNAANRGLQIRVSLNIGAYMTEDGEVEAGLARLRQCVLDSDALMDRSIRFQSRLVFGRKLAEIDLAGGEAVLREAAAELGEEKTPELAEVYRDLSNVLAKRGFSEDALAYSQRAIDILRSK